MSETQVQPVALVLASKSPRRAALLREAGFGEALVVMDPPYDDPATPNARTNEDAEAFAASTATRKARSLVEAQTVFDSVILAADTVCVGADDQLLGKPYETDELLAMLRGFVDATHLVVTGVALLATDGHGTVTHEEAWSDAASVVWGSIEPAALLAYARTDAWQGKAGGYNLDERVAAGWPISVDGDPTTVVGLPMRRLVPALARLGVASCSPAAAEPAP